MESTIQKEVKVGIFYEGLEEEERKMRQRDIPLWVAAIFVVIMIIIEIATRDWLYGLAIDIGIIFVLLYRTDDLTKRIRGIQKDIKGIRQQIGKP